MANRFFNPDEQFCDATGLPYAGGSLTFYASGTTTLQNTYSDKALSIANTNPVVLDSAGRAGSIFLQNLSYKVVLEDASNNVIWTFDPVYASDFSTVAQFQSGTGSPNGSVAGSAGSATIPASVYWDATNQILYVCTQTGTTSTAVWTAINSSSAAAVVPPPQGYLTLTSATPIIPSDVTAATTVYYTPYVGNLIPIYNGTSFTPTVFAELSCALVSAHTANSVFDLFVFNNSGVLTLVTGPAWSSTTARGTGAGTTQISRINGLWVNTVSMTGRNGATTYTIPANQATLVASMYIDGTAGQVTCTRTSGQNRKWGVSNAYNRVPIILQVADGAGSWTFTGASFRASHNAPAAYASNSFNVGSGVTCNGGVILQCLAEEEVDINFEQTVSFTLGANTGQASIGVGINSIIASSGKQGQYELTGSGGSFSDLVAKYPLPPTLGVTNFVGLEAAGAAATPTFEGTGASMILSAAWRG